MPRKRAILVHNPTAGKGPGAHSAAQLLGWLAEAGIQARLVNAKKKKEMRKLNEANGLIVIAGGDGTVHKVARRVVGRQTTLAVIPLGTANNIARSLGIVGEPRALIAGLGRARERALDVGIAEGPWGKRAFLEGAGGGLFADVMARLDGGRPRKKRRADAENHKTRFTPYDLHLQPALHALAEALPEFRARASDVAIDGKRISGRYLLLEAMNMPFLGPNLHLGPDADPGDGKLDFVLLDEDQRKEFQDYLAHRIEGGDDAPRVTTIKGERLEFAWGGARLHVDDKVMSLNGENGTERKRLEIVLRVKPGALTFLLPRKPRHAGLARGKSKIGPSPRLRHKIALPRIAPHATS
jgi:diacylglycerol kinase family enzyme